MTATPEGSTSHSMPRSKHRRKGRVRPRQNRKPAPQLPPLPSIDYEWEQHKSAVEEEQLRKMFGEKPPDGWTDNQIETMVEEIERAQRQDPLLEAPTGRHQGHRALTVDATGHQRATALHNELEAYKKAPAIMAEWQRRGEEFTALSREYYRGNVKKTNFVKAFKEYKGYVDKRVLTKDT
jgi:hypothetical protein